MKKGENNSDKIGNKTEKDEVFHYFLNYHTASENVIFYDELKID